MVSHSLAAVRKLAGWPLSTTDGGQQAYNWPGAKRVSYLIGGLTCRMEKPRTNFVVEAGNQQHPYRLLSMAETVPCRIATSVTDPDPPPSLEEPPILQE